MANFLKDLTCRLGGCLAWGAILVMVMTAMPWTTSASKKDSRRYVMIVANNGSLDEGVEPLRFADDDGARYYEMFLASGADVTLLAVMDADAQMKFPRAAAAASLPNRATLSAMLGVIFSKIRRDNALGILTEFVFIYAGHGSIGPNREGYLNLLDERLTRRIFYRDIIAPSPATYNHIILDACHAYFMVNKRGETTHRKGAYRDEILDFLKAEQLSSYPNTGIILATSKSSETHEWQQFESGIFSHELISALLGAADVNEDGLITYSEAAACVEAANAAVTIPRARLSVYFNPPAQQVLSPLMDLASFRDTPLAIFNKELSNRYTIEDGRGIRIADFNYTHEQSIKINLIGKSPFFIRTKTTEAVISDTGVIPLALSDFRPLTIRPRGSVEQSFRRDLFILPFGIGFYRGMFTRTKNPGIGPQIPIAPGDNVYADGKLPYYAVIGWSALGAGIAAGIASGVVYGTARGSYSDYKAADEKETAIRLRQETEDRLLFSQVLLGSAIGLSALGGAMLVVHGIKKSRRPSSVAFHKPRITPMLVLSSYSGYLGIDGAF